MSDRKTRLIEAGMMLFAEKGYHNTSVQEIVSEAGISKGAFYIYFKSKEDFMATSFYYFHLKLSEKVIRVINEKLEPKESLAKQITVVTNYIDEHKNFIIMHLREDISIGEDMEAAFTQIRLKNYRWMTMNIKAIYGDKVDDYLMDSIVQMEGLMNGYFQWIVLDHIKIDQKRIGMFLVDRLNDIVNGMIASDKGSIILSESIIQNEAMIKNEEKKFERVGIIYQMEKKIAILNLPAKEKERLNEVIKKLAEELDGEKNDCITIQGLLAHFKGIEALEPECKQIAKLLEINLLD